MEFLYVYLIIPVLVILLIIMMIYCVHRRREVGELEGPIIIYNPVGPAGVFIDKQ